MYSAMGAYMSASAYFRASPVKHLQFMLPQDDDCFLNLDMEKLAAAALEFYEKNPGETFNIRCKNWRVPPESYM